MADAVVCVTHGKDVDGIVAGSLIHRAHGAAVIPTDYGETVATLRRVGAPQVFYLCDLGFSERTSPDFLQELGRLRRSGEVTYVDHHPLSTDLRDRLDSLGIRVIHSLHECTSVLVQQAFAQMLSPHARLLAGIAAVTDYMDQQPVARRLIEGFDRQFLLLEATLLSYALAWAGDDSHFVASLIRELARDRYPHEIPHVREYAGQQLTKVSQLIGTVQKLGRRRNNLAYVETEERATGIVANLVIGAFSTPVGAAYRCKPTENACDVSLRSVEEYPGHLGEIIADVAHRLGGFGGGHAHAAGGRVPLDRLDDLLAELASRV